jgi:hypothetical protein
MKKLFFFTCNAYDCLQHNLSLFQMTVFARDFGTPQLQSLESATVTINVIRNNFGPVFQNTPYAREISQSIATGTSVFRVNATDADTSVSVYRHCKSEKTFSHYTTFWKSRIE